MNSPVLPLLVTIGLSMGGVYAIGRHVRGAWPAHLLRVLAVTGFVLPGWTILRWYEGLVRVRDATQGLPVDPQPAMQRFLASSAALLSVGFGLLVVGIYLARRLPGGQTRGEVNQ